MKAKTTATLRLKPSGEVIGEIENEYGIVVSARRFGVMTEDEFQKCLRLIEKVFLEAPAIGYESDENSRAGLSSRFLSGVISSDEFF